MDKWARTAALVAFASLLAPAIAAPVPGGLAKVDLGSGDAAPHLRPEARVGESRVLVMREGGRWYAIVGIALATEPGSRLTVDVEYPGGSRGSYEIPVGTKKYREQHLKVPAERDDLSAHELEQFERERARLTQLLRTFSEPPPATLALVAPARGRRTGSFGLRRVINGLPRNPHTGLDIAAPTGTPVLAAAGGRVIDRGTYFFLGETVVLDHGHGLISLYSHLRKSYPQVGESVAASAPIGEVGATGRATGPHMHFAVYLNGVAVDPALLLRR